MKHTESDMNGLENFFAQAKSMALSDTERAALRQSLLRHMAQAPLESPQSRRFKKYLDIFNLKKWLGGILGLLMVSAVSSHAPERNTLTEGVSC